MAWKWRGCDVDVAWMWRGCGVVEDHSKADGLDLRQPHGAQAVGLVWRGEAAITGWASNEGQSCQAVVIPFYSSIVQVFAVFFFK